MLVAAGIVGIANLWFARAWTGPGVDRTSAILPFAGAALWALFRLLPQSRERTWKLPDGRTLFAARGSSPLRFATASLVLCAVMGAGIATRVRFYTLPMAHVVVMAAITTFWLWELTRWLTRLRIVVPATVRVGAAFEVTATVTAPVNPRRQHAALVIRERAVLADHEPDAAPTFEVLDTVAVNRPTTLPAALPGSIDAGPHRVEWLLQCRVEIPWWPDLEATLPLDVGWQPLPARERQRERTAASRAKHALPRVAPGAAPQLALDPGADAVGPGAAITGAVTWAAAAPPARVHVALEWEARPRTGAGHIERVASVDVAELSRETRALDSADPYRAAPPIAEQGALAAHDHRTFTLPAPLRPLTYAGALFDLRWSVVVTATAADGTETTDRRGITIGTGALDVAA